MKLRTRKPKAKGIYVLSCPDTGEIRYIGQTKDAAKRYTAHKCDTENGAKGRWVSSLKAEGKAPKMTMVIETDDLDAEEVELISIYRAMGANLLNIADGGKLRPAHLAGKSRSPWVGKGGAVPTGIFLRSWANRYLDKAEYRAKAKPFKDWLKRMNEAERMWAEMRIADSLIAGGHGKGLESWFSDIKHNAINVIPEVRAELEGI